MLPKGSAKKVIIYVNEDTRHHVEPLWNVIFTFLRQKRVAGATVLRPELGFGGSGEVHDAGSEYVSSHLPVRVEFIETAQRVDELLPALHDMVTDGLIEVQETTVVKSVSGKHPDAQAVPMRQKSAMVAGPAKLVRIYLGESDRSGDIPLYEAIVLKLRMLDFSGATVYRGILGYGVKRHTHKAGMLHLSRDLPIMISVAERADRVDELVRVVADMMQDGLIAVSDIEMYRVLQPAAPEADV
jgi:PII-like signaling protein